MALTHAYLVGQSEQHLCSAAEGEVLGARIHEDAVEPFLQLRAAAGKAGFDLAILSGFRDFDRQLGIWNRKATGQQAVLDSSAVPLDIGSLSPKEIVFAILRWSALPGASRHHWGTDLDVFDAAARPQGYEIELIPEEVDSGGLFGPLHAWLDERIAADEAFGFFRPYERDRGGVAPERWHLSYAPVAERYTRLLTPAIITDSIRQADIEMKDVVLDNIEEIYGRFVINICQDPA